MAEVLNVHALHDNGAAKVQIGLRKHAFVIAYNDTSGSITFTDPTTGESISIDGVAMEDSVPKVTISDTAPMTTTEGKPKDIWIVYNASGTTPVTGLWVMNEQRVWLHIL